MCTTSSFLSSFPERFSKNGLYLRKEQSKGFRPDIKELMGYIHFVLFLEKQLKENFAQLSVMNKLKSNHYSNLQLKTNCTHLTLYS